MDNSNTETFGVNLYKVLDFSIQNWPTVDFGQLFGKLARIEILIV